MLTKHRLINKCNFSDNIIDGGYRRQPATGAKNKQNIFKTNYKVYLIADATAYKMTNYYFDRLTSLGIHKKDQSMMKPHITLMEIIVNGENPDHKYIVDAYGQINTSLRELLNTKYQQLSPQMYINSNKQDYEIMGDFLAKIYKSTNSYYITDFRIAFYKYLEIMLGKSTRNVILFGDKKYFIYSYNGKELMAIPEYYHGKGQWKPHISIIKLDKISKSNPSLFGAYQKYGVISLIKELLKVKGSIDQLNMSYHFNSLRTPIIKI